MSAEPQALEGAAYETRAARWGDEIARASETRARLWRGVAIGLGALALVQALGLALLIPLKETTPYVVTVDRHTGEAQATRTPMQGQVTQDEAVIRSLVAQYVIARETYDPYDQQERYDLIALMSADQAAASYNALWAPTNERNPGKVFGLKQRIHIAVRAINFLNDKTANVRFTRSMRAADGRETARTDVTAIIAWRFAPRAMSLEDLIRNPLAFEVVSWRADEDFKGAS